MWGVLRVCTELLFRAKPKTKPWIQTNLNLVKGLVWIQTAQLCGLVVRALAWDSGDLGFIPSCTKGLQLLPGCLLALATSSVALLPLPMLPPKGSES